MFPLHRVDQGGLFPADVGARTTDDADGEIEAFLAEDVLPEEIGSLRFVDGLLQDAEGLGVLVAEVDESPARPGGIGPQDHALEHGVGVVIHDGAVLEAAGLTLVGVADHGLGKAVRLGHCLGLEAGREAGPAATRKARIGHQPEECLGR